jgi:hypothetical protein
MADVFAGRPVGVSAGMTINTPLPPPYAWLYSDRAAIVRVVERPLVDGRVEVMADGPSAVRGRHLFPTMAAATQFRQIVQRQLIAGGFHEVWASARSSSSRRDRNAAASSRTETDRAAF